MMGGEAPDIREVECHGECLGACDIHAPGADQEGDSR